MPVKNNNKFFQEYAPKFPLLIDPDGIGYQRILEWEYDNKLVTIDMSNR